MGLKSANEASLLLDDNQTKIYNIIMEDMVESFLGNMQKHRELLQGADTLLDLSLIILFVFNREMIAHIISSFNLEHKRKELMKDFFVKLKNEINRVINERMV